MKKVFYLSPTLCKTIGNGLQSGGVLVGLFFIAVIIEAGIRGLFGEPIAVAINGDLPAKVQGAVQPDFCWLGQAWVVNIECSSPVLIDFDGQWKVFVPIGNHSIIHNHDTNNTLDLAQPAEMNVHR